MTLLGIALAIAQLINFGLILSARRGPFALHGHFPSLPRPRSPKLIGARQ
jgi:hypothetical protein